MRLLITDSGVGGLSVCAYAERYLRAHGIGEPVALTYVNASRENDFGYNSMGSRQEKLEHFDRFLGIITEIYSPDQIYIACNTLSVLFPDTDFSASRRLPVRGIVETGASRLLRELDRSRGSVAVIFGTPTTIEEGAYSELLGRSRIEASRIVEQACPSLADTISEDRQGSSAREKIEGFVVEAIERMPSSSGNSLTYLACTHYGYRKAFFERAFADRGVTTQVLNPNEFVVDDLFDAFDRSPVKDGGEPDVSVNFVTRYRIPETALETIAFFLEDISPATVEAFTDYLYAPDLF
jgi:glutamate racemase